MGGEKMKRIVMLMVILGVTLCHILPAMADGDVKADLTNSGNLKIIGDKQSNQIRVTNNGLGNIRVEGINGTTVNGGLGGTDLPGTSSDTISGKLDVNLKGGDNYVEIDDIAITRSLQLKFDHGDNTIGIFDTPVLGDALLRMGNGDNFITIAGVTLINNKLTVNTGNGNDSIEIAECVSVGGKTMIKTQSGDDVINLRGTYLGPLTVDTGKDNDVFYISKFTDNNNVDLKLGNGVDTILFASTASLTGRVTIKGDKGTDTLIQDDGVSGSFDPTTKSIENTHVDAAADEVPDAITLQMFVEYTSRGGNSANIACP